VALRGLHAIDQRTAPARALVAWRAELIAALGGETNLSPQRRKLIELAARAALLLDHVDAWIFEQPNLVNRRNKSLVPALLQRQSLAEHLAKLLDRLGLDRLPAKISTLDAYVAEQYSKADNGSQDRSGPSSTTLET
jgi:hypothetical protein